MPKCPNCPQFTSKDTDVDPEIDARVDDDGAVNVSVRLVNSCSECGDELEESNLEIEIDLSAEIRAHRDEEHKSKVTELSVEADGSRTDETQTKDRHGKPIKSSRYMRRYYGVEVTATVTCECGSEFVAGGSDKVAASGMESLV